MNQHLKMFSLGYFKIGYHVVFNDAKSDDLILHSHCQKGSSRPYLTLEDKVDTKLYLRT